MTLITTYIVDSFTNEPFKGNPAGVCLLEKELSEEKMLLIAQELGFSETAFVMALETPNSYSIRYFSPKVEIPLCGHATLASAKALFEQHPDYNKIQFKTIRDISLDVSKIGTSIQMVFPLYEVTPVAIPDGMLESLGIESAVNCTYNVETNSLILEIEDSEVLSGLNPNYEALVKTHDTINGVSVTAPSKKENFDFESRYFWPWSGTNEDPVTGGAHTFLTPYWNKRLNKTKMNSFQCSERSGSMVVEIINEDQFTITGEAQIVLKGRLRV